MIALSGDSCGCGSRRKFSPEEYFQWELQQELRYEYIDGEVFAMAGGTISHSAIAVNLIALLRPYLRGSNCRVLGSDAKVEISENFFYPDLLVTCDERDRLSIRSVSYPKLIIEVLSASTEGYDRGIKFARYRKLESLKEYILISSTDMSVEAFRLNERGKWELTPYTAKDIVQFTSIDFECAIAEIYEDVDLY